MPLGTTLWTPRQGWETLTAVYADLLKQTLVEHLKQYGQEHSDCAVEATELILTWSRSEESLSFADWGRKQSCSAVIALQRYLFWMWQNGHLDGSLHNELHHTLTPVLTSSWSMPVVITRGADDPLLEGGFLERRFVINQFQFDPGKRQLIVSHKSSPNSRQTCLSLDAVLDFLSFLLKSGADRLGFRQMVSQKTSSSETALVSVGVGPRVQVLPDFDFELIDKALTRIIGQTTRGGLSLSQLLHVRHRAILDSNPESRIITLWSAIEAQFGREEKQDSLLSKAERKEMGKKLGFLPPDKRSAVMNHVARLKRRTRNDRIIEGLANLECAIDWDVRVIVGDIHALRSKFAHGGFMSPDDKKKTAQYISAMLDIIEETAIGHLRQLNLEIA